MAYMEFLKSARGRVVDDLLILKAKGTVASTLAGEDPLGTAKYYDTGGGRTRGDVCINVYNYAHVSGGTSVIFTLQGSKNSSFSTINDLQILELGDSTQITGGTSLTTGRYLLPFTNDFNGTVYRYLRHYAVMASVGTGFEYECYLGDIIT